MPKGKPKQAGARIANQAIETVPVESLSLHPRNANEGDVGAIYGSIEANGFYGTIVAQRSTGHILAGNHRYQAGVAAGLTEVPVAWVECNDEEALRILVADNRTTRLGRDNEAALAELLAELANTEVGLEGTGFDGEDLDRLIADVAGESEELRQEEGGIESVPAQFIVMVDCKSEQEQADLLQRFLDEGLSCRALTS